jgi:hypothetical protein
MVAEGTRALLRKVAKLEVRAGRLVLPSIPYCG